MVIIGAIIALVLATVGIPAALYCAGFTSAGVAAYSLAAFIQSCIGSVPAGGFFAALQSAGAAGISWLTTAIITATGAIIGWFTGNG